MVVIRQGRIEGGHLIIQEPVALPDGTEVRVVIELVVAVSQPAADRQPLDYATLPSFGMWVDRKEMEDSAAWVNEQRDAWQHPIRPAE